MNKTTTTNQKVRGLKKINIFKILGVYMDRKGNIRKTNLIAK